MDISVLGHDNVSILDGGWRAWVSAGEKVESGPVATHRAKFTAHYNPALRAELPEVAQAIQDGREALVDARPPAQWVGTAKTSAVRAYGHLPGAIWIDQSQALEPDGHLKPRPELARVFAPAGTGPVTTYCNTGHLAATDWFVLSEMLGQPNTKLYDGSMSEWAADPTRPVVR
ncbi:MAG: sulfurtransferase [Acetobacteraceae bacterium]|nr:sulfurtransferase [Acetobacteraceae bacterium]